MTVPSASLTVRLANSTADVLAAQRLRYQVFVQELHGGGDSADHAQGIETDSFDAAADHLLLVDAARAENDGVVGVYRLMSQAQADQVGGYYSAAEYDLTPLARSGATLLELGRSCLHVDYRGGPGMYLLWQALARHVAATDVQILFGVASFHGTDPAPLHGILSLLHRDHRAPEPLRVRARPEHALSMDILPPDQIDRRSAMIAMPPLIKAYLRLGGVVGDGAWVDHAFNTTDVFVMLDVTRMSPLQKARYLRGSA